MTRPAPDAVAIRPGTPDDAERLTRLHLDCWDDAYTGLVPQHLLDARRQDVPARVARWRSILSGPHGTLVADAGDDLVGFASAGPGRDAEPPPGVTAELWALYVRAGRWGTGVGHRLLTASLGDAPAYLWVLAGNERAEAFYRRQGFVADGAVTEEDEGRHVRMVRSGPAESPARRDG
ncbi:MAG: N-acetyltransferase family protein [Nocardioides sp.]